MPTLQEDISTIFNAAIAKAYGDELRDTDPLIRESDRADFQANFALGLSKQVGKPPREVADTVTALIDQNELIDGLEIAGPGFINISLNTDALASRINTLSGNARGGIAETSNPRRVIVEYSAPNVAKEMHIGHLRSTIIGDALARILSFAGNDVVRQNHIGDWGTPFGMLIEHMIDLGQDEAAHELSVGDLDQFYKQARQKFDSDKAFADRSRARVVLLQAGDAETMQFWGFLNEKSREYFNSVYKKLGVLLTDDDLDGESSYNDDLEAVANELENAGIAKIDDGALCVFPEGFNSRDGSPLPLIIRKTGGGFGYAATDLAAIRRRVREIKVDDSYYVVDSRQAQHFAMVFAVARMAGWLSEESRFEHIAFGSVLGSDGKPYKTRSGDVAKLVDLLDEAELRAATAIEERNPELSAEEKSATARAIGIGAIKYSDLSNDRIKDYTFDFDRMLAFEGNTAPYIQYAHARIYSIFRKAGINADSFSASVKIQDPEERLLALKLLAFPVAFAEAVSYLAPHRICTYLFELASQYTTFYEKCPVLKAEDESVRDSRLALSLQTAKTLALGLSMLGIDAPTRM